MQPPWLYRYRFLFQLLSRDEGDRYLNSLLQQEFLTYVALASVNTPRHSSNNKIFDVFEMDDGVLAVVHDSKRK